MTTPSYTLQQAQSDVANLRGQIAHLQAFAELLQVQIDSSLTLGPSAVLTMPDFSTWTASGASFNSAATMTLPDGSQWTSAGLNELVLKGVSTPATPASGNGLLYSTTNGTPSVMTDSGMTGQIPVIQTDVSVITVTQAANTALTASYTIPANDMNVGTTYRLVSYGSGQQGSTVQAITPTVNIGGGSSSIGGYGGIATASVVFDWVMFGWANVTATGSGGTLNIFGQFCLNERTSPFSSAGPPFVATIGQSFDTTTSTTMRFGFAWNATTGAPTITSRGSIFERLGP